mmetsp:Transcript_5689/g.13307  ORF Transcript_5689/g.13307 Transcript_5689/m.13307 type:complete len:232 (+) Transcript_5689:852-1547(+)
MQVKKTRYWQSPVALSTSTAISETGPSLNLFKIASFSPCTPIVVEKSLALLRHADSCPSCDCEFILASSIHELVCFDDQARSFCLASNPGKRAFIFFKKYRCCSCTLLAWTSLKLADSLYNVSYFAVSAKESPDIAFPPSPIRIKSREKYPRASLWHFSKSDNVSFSFALKVLERLWTSSLFSRDMATTSSGTFRLFAVITSSSRSLFAPLTGCDSLLDCAACGGGALLAP